MEQKSETEEFLMSLLDVSKWIRRAAWRQTDLT